MSNYSKVIVTWSGVDEIASASVPEIRRRADALIASQSDKRFPQLSISWPCGMSPPGFETSGCCETALVFSCNYFDADAALECLASMEWETPEEVELFWKDEEAMQYEHGRLLRLST